MGRVRVDLRLPEELVARVDVRAGELGQTRTKFVERALESALKDSVPGASMLPVEKTGPVPVGRAASTRAPEDIPGVSRAVGVFECPVPGCSRSFGSAAAVCPSHGRRAVSVH